MKPRARKRRAVLQPTVPYSPGMMSEVTASDLRDFRRHHKSVLIEQVEVPLGGPWTVREVGPPADYKPPTTTVWSYPDRGSWATHSGNYRGNWSPYIPRNVLLRYTSPGDLVLDQMMGSGTTLVECRLLDRNAIGVDLNPNAVMVARDRLDFQLRPLDESVHEPTITTYVGDARRLSSVEDSAIDLVATHPPYAGIVSYSGNRLPGDLSASRSISEFIEAMDGVARECYRVLKPGKHAAILMGDTRRHRHFVPITARVLQTFLSAGFVLREDVIKVQWNMKSTRESWAGKKYDFLLLAHEHLFVFRKLLPAELPGQFRDSAKWWDAV